MKTNVSIKDGLKALRDGINLNSFNNSRSSIKINLIVQSSFQPRQYFDETELKHLMLSIQERGVIQPIVVREVLEGKYEIISGERRWRAAQLAGLTEIPAVIRKSDNQDALVCAIIENIQRENLNPIEEAESFNALINEYNLTHEQVAKNLGKPRSSVSNSIRLLELEPASRAYVIENKISMGHAKVLLALVGNEQIEVANKIIAENLNVRQTEKLVEKIKAGQSDYDATNTESPFKDKSNEFEIVLKRLFQLKNKVQINHDGSGSLKIIFDSLHEIDWLIGELSKLK